MQKILKARGSVVAVLALMAMSFMMHATSASAASGDNWFRTKGFITWQAGLDSGRVQGLINDLGDGALGTGSTAAIAAAFSVPTATALGIATGLAGLGQLVLNRCSNHGAKGVVLSGIMYWDVPNLRWNYIPTWCSSQ